MLWSNTLKTFRKNASKDLSDSEVGNSIINSQMTSCSSSRQPTPVSSDTEDNGELTEDQKRCARVGKKKAVAASQRALPAPPPQKMLPGPAAQKALPAPEPIPEAKASKPMKGQESPVAKATHPMAIRRQEASRARGLRSGGGSGQTDTRVAKGNPSKT
jgi:hypothetical protein